MNMQIFYFCQLGAGFILVVEIYCITVDRAAISCFSLILGVATTKIKL